MVNRAAEDTLQGKQHFHRIISLLLKKSMKRDQELILITKTYDLVLWSCNHTGKFPRNHRFVLGERIERNLHGLLETLIAAKYTKNRQRLLEEANLSLEVLRFQMRLAKDLQCPKVESYGFAAKPISSKARDQRERLSLLMVDLSQAIDHYFGSQIFATSAYSAVPSAGSYSA